MIFKKSKLPAMSNCATVFILPEDVLREIFIRLPVKSIGKSRCLSKQCNSFLTSPRCINAHLARLQHKSLLIRINDDNGPLFTSTLRPDKDAGGTLKKLNFVPPLDQNSTMLIGHCDGLVVIATGGERWHLLIMNPITLEHSRLPESPNFASRPYESEIGCGFGYDSSRDDYKVVSICKVDDNSLVDHGNCYIYADIYSVKTKYWRRVDLDCNRPFIGRSYYQGSVFFNGALHWMSFNPEDVILALDLGSEKFYEIPSLGSLRGEHNYEDTLIVSKGCLGIVCWDHVNVRCHIWTMNKYGMADSWTKSVYILDGPWIGVYRPWRDTLLIEYHNKLIIYSFSDEKSFSVTFDKPTSDDVDDDNYFDDGLIFTESLVSPNHFDTEQHLITPTVMSIL